MSENPYPLVFHISPLVRITLLGLYLALTLPLPFLAQMSVSPVPPELLGIGIIVGAIALYGTLSERVVLEETRIQVTYPRWVPAFFRKGWSLSWSEIKALKPRTTGQGGLVYYFLTHSERAYLLPMRVAGFTKLVREVQAKTGINTTDIKPLAQPWMYFILFGLMLLLILIDLWTIGMSLQFVNPL